MPMIAVRNSARQRQGRGEERGYVLLTLLLTMAILVIAAGVAATSIAFNIRRDREEELIHRGVQYTRAIREYSRRTGHFPMRLDELDSTNGRRYLRRHYKDPITNREFKMVYMVEVVRGGLMPAQQPGLGNGAPGFSSPSLSPSGTGTPVTPPASADPSQTSQPASSSDDQSKTETGSNTNSDSNQPVSVGLIVGVVSRSKDKTIREFSGKNHYDQWRFYYDPAFDKYALKNAPTVNPLFEPAPKLQGAQTPDQMNSATQQPAPAQAAPVYQ